MAQKTVVSVLCDLDGKDGAKTVSLGLDGDEREVDVCPEHERELREGVAEYIAHARRIAHSNGHPRRRRTRSTDNEATRARAWAKEHGITLSERGRIPAHVMEQWRARNGGRPAVPFVPEVIPPQPPGVAANDPEPEPQPSSDPPSREDMRAWAQWKGLPVKRTGILPGAIVKQYQDEHPPKPASRRTSRAGGR